MHRLGGIIGYEVNTYLQYVICNEDGVILIPSTTLVSVYILKSVCLCRCIIYDMSRPVHVNSRNGRKFLIKLTV